MYKNEHRRQCDCLADERPYRDIFEILHCCIDPVCTNGRQQNGNALDKNQTLVFLKPGNKDQAKRQRCIGKDGCCRVDGKNT